MSHTLMFYWFEPALYFDPVFKFPESTEKAWIIYSIYRYYRSCIDIYDSEK
jgi:hypothetical protein